MIGNKLTAKQRVERAYVELMGHPSTIEYSGLLMVGKYEVRDDVRTACTDGVNCSYGMKFVEKLDAAELRGLILHETLHKAFQHMFLWKHLWKQNPRKSNMACDYVINLIIKDLDDDTGGFVRLPEGGLLSEDYRGMDSQQVFDALSDGDDDNDSGGDSLDDHDWESGEQMSDADREQLGKDIDQAIRQGRMAAEKLKGATSQTLGALVEPKVDWREQLRDFICAYTDGKDVSTWARPARRWLQHDVYMPSTVSESIDRIVVAVDTSYSIGDAELTKFLSEVQSLCAAVSPQQVDLLYWGTEVVKHEVYGRDKQGTLAQSTKHESGGGTDPSCVSDYLRENRINPECVVVLTDGEVPNWGRFDVPTLWCIVDNKRAHPTNGVAIHID
jgi:predicted metal-dependent peptidase